MRSVLRLRDRGVVSRAIMWDPSIDPKTMFFYDLSDFSTISFSSSGVIYAVADKSRWSNPSLKRGTSSATDLTYSFIRKAAEFSSNSAMYSNLRKPYLSGNEINTIIGGFNRTSSLTATNQHVFSLFTSSSSTSGTIHLISSDNLSANPTQRYVSIRYGNGRSESSIDCNTQFVCVANTYKTNHGSAILRINGTQVSYTPSSGSSTLSFSTSATIWFGGYGYNGLASSTYCFSNNCIGSGYGEFFLGYDGEAPTEYVQKVEGWWAWNWGHQLLLPATHPYKNAPPIK